MGKSKGSYKAEFPVGTTVKIASREFLEEFKNTWKFHNKLKTEQLDYANKTSKVISVGFYHGGDELYKLKNISGIWHEPCLVKIDPKPL